MACDLCGKIGGERIDLRDEYKTELIAEVCEDCRKDLDKQLLKIKIAASDWTVGVFKRWMHNRWKALRGKEVA